MVDELWCYTSMNVVQWDLKPEKASNARQRVLNEAAHEKRTKDTDTFLSVGT
jgi:hypothetical protein